MAGSPQQREPITVGPYYLTQPFNFRCRRKPEYPENFRQSVDLYYFHMRVGSSHMIEKHFNRTRDLMYRSPSDRWVTVTIGKRRPPSDRGEKVGGEAGLYPSTFTDPVLEKKFKFLRHTNVLCGCSNVDLSSTLILC